MYNGNSGGGSIPHDHVARSESDALSAAESYVAASADPSRACDGGREKFSATFEALCCWGEENGLIRHPGDFDCFTRHPDGYGDEHQAWFDESSGRWFKATYENRFGLAWGRRGTATAREYLTRLILQNKYFGDDIHLIALINVQQKLRVLISQPHIAGQPAAYQEIQTWFRFLGFARVEIGGSIAWYRSVENLLVADAHEGNVIKIPVAPSVEAAVLFPIDLNLVQPNGSLLDGLLEHMETLRVMEQSEFPL
jgi:hypothetical protein